MYGCQQALWLYGEDEQITEAGTMAIFAHFINDKGGRWKMQIYQYLVNNEITSSHVAAIASHSIGIFFQVWGQWPSNIDTLSRNQLKQRL